MVGVMALAASLGLDFVEDAFARENEVSAAAPVIRSTKELAEWFRDRQRRWLEFLPPDEEFALTQSEPALVIDPARLPRALVSRLKADTAWDMAVYPVTIREDFQTRELTIWNADGKLVQRIPAPKGYDPFAELPTWLAVQRDALGDEVERECFDMLNDPARIGIAVNLLPEASVAAYEAAVEEQAALNTIWTEALARTLSAPLPDDLMFDAITPVSQGVQLELWIPSTFTGPMEIYSIGDLCSFPWTLEATEAVAPETTVEITLPTSDSVRFFRAADAGVDGDGDGLPDSQELMRHGTDPTDPDTDGDGLDDSDEVLTYGTSPLKADSDDDGMLDNIELATGTNPNIFTEEGNAGLIRWTPMREVAE